MVAALSLLLYMHLWFVAAVIRRRNDFADIAWALGFVLLGAVEFIDRLPVVTPRSMTVLGLVLIWGLRLSGYIAFRSYGRPEDPRYQQMRSSWGDRWLLNTYFKVFLLQGVLLFIIAQPMLAALRLPATPLGLLDQIAESVAVFGFLIEAIADYQKNKFKSKPENRGRICDVGLWSKARHPNYFGEMIFWIGISLFSLHDVHSYWWVWISPIVLIFLLLKVSGVPLIEKRYAGRDDYENYRSRTNLLLPIR